MALLFYFSALLPPIALAKFTDFERISGLTLKFNAYSK